MLIPIRNAVFENRIELPEAVSCYRNILYGHLYNKCDSMLFQSVCWASVDIGKPAGSSVFGMPVFPGEEAFLEKQRSIMLDGDSPFGVTCPHHRLESGRSDSVPQKSVHICTLNPKERPLHCRMFPLRVQRMPGRERSATIVCAKPLIGKVISKGDQEVDQMCYNVANAYTLLWNFLSEAWWEFIERTFSCVEWVEIAQFSFEIDTDTVMSVISESTPEWKAELLKEIAKPECKVCGGTGIEFWDLVKSPQGGFIPIPVAQRRFDLCRECVVPSVQRML